MKSTRNENNEAAYNGRLRTCDGIKEVEKAKIRSDIKTGLLN